MRLLSEQERELCLQIVKGKNGYNSIQNIIDYRLANVLISIDKNTKEVDIEFPVRSLPLTSEEQQAIMERLNEVAILILTTVNLISMFEKAGYLLAYQRANIVGSTIRFGQGMGNLPHNVSYQFPDHKVADLLIQYVDKEIVVTPEFERFCNNGFIPRDEQRFERQITIAYIALAVALIAAFTNLGFNIKKSSSPGTKILPLQVKDVTDRLDLIKQRLDSIYDSTKSSQVKPAASKAGVKTMPDKSQGQSTQ